MAVSVVLPPPRANHSTLESLARMEDLPPAAAWPNAFCLAQSEAGGDAQRSTRQDRWMEEQIAINLPTELLDRVDHIARHTGRSRAEVITSALHRGLRDDDRVQAIIDAFDEIDT